MQIIVIASRTRQGGRLTPALLSAGSTWHAPPLRPLVTAGRFYAPCSILLTNPN